MNSLLIWFCFVANVAGPTHASSEPPVATTDGSATQTSDPISSEAIPYEVPYPNATSKKGLQVEIVSDAIKLGIQHAAINIDLCHLIRPNGGGEVEEMIKDGETYHFDRHYLRELDDQIRPLSDKNVLVNLILLTYRSGNDDVDKILIHPDCIAEPPNRLGAFNSRTEEGRRWLTATLTFLAKRWSRPDEHFGRVVGWIVGNEVNSHWWWANQGLTSMETFVDDYARTVRLVHAAVRSVSTSDRVYISLEHHWNIRYSPASGLMAFPGRPFLNAFAKKIRDEGDIDWHLAFHPYPENLFDPAFWLDATATPNPNSPRITFKNLEVLCQFMTQPNLTYENTPRRIILSEQGFHSTLDAAGEQLQAAAYCYAYRLVDQLPQIDAFILHRHVDHPNEGGLHLGLRRRADVVGDIEASRPRKPIYRCFQYADTDQWEEAFRFALPIVGLESWPQSQSTTPISDDDDK